MFPDHTVTQIRDSVVGRADTLDGFFAKASIAIARKDEKARFSAEIHHRRRDSLLMRARGPLGVEGVRALVTVDSFFLYDRVKKQLFYGDINSSNELLIEPIYGDDLFRDLLGIPTISDDVDWRVESDSSMYYLHDDGSRRMYMVDPGLWRVVRYTRRGEDGKLLEERSFTEFGVIDDVFLPRRITLRRPQDRTVASVFYRSIDLNPPGYQFALGVGNDVEYVPVY